MLNKKYKIISVIITCFLIIGILGNLASVYVSAKDGSGNTILLIHQIIGALVSAFAVYYLDAGAKKGVGSKLFKCFVYSYVAYLAILLLLKTDLTILCLLIGIQMSLLSIIAIAKDLGEAKSKIISSIIILFEIIVSLICLFNDFEMFKLVAFDKLSSLLISITCLFLIFAKYEDKKQRYAAQKSENN